MQFSSGDDLSNYFNENDVGQFHSLPMSLFSVMQFAQLGDVDFNNFENAVHKELMVVY